MTSTHQAPLPLAGGITNYTFSDKDFSTIAHHAQQDFGLHLTPAKRDLVYSRLSKRLRQLGLSDFAAYCKLLEGPDSNAERMEMLSALTTNVTHFFREEHHFQTLRDKVLPPLISAARSGGRLRIWSAGCSAGQEPYSLALTVLELCPDAARFDIRILATDVDPVIIARAKAGIYDIEEMKALPQQAQNHHITNRTAKTFEIGKAPRDLITFGELNLMQDWPMRGLFDVIFCRNVAIYFSQETQSRLWTRFAGLLPIGGHLCIGHSERVAGPAKDILAAAGVTTYRKIGSLDAVKT